MNVDRDSCAPSRPRGRRRRRSVGANLAGSTVLVEAEGLAAAGGLGAYAATHYAARSFLKHA